MKAAAIVLVAVILSLVLSKNGKEFQITLTLGACCVVLLTVCSFLNPILNLVESLITVGEIDRDMIQILLKATGISLLTEYMVLICQDAGNSALGKSLQVLSSAVILWLSLPLIHSLIDIITNILSAT